MSNRFHVDANLMSTPFSTAANTLGARNEERRLERIYGGPPRAKEDSWERVMRSAQEYRDDKALEAQSRAKFGTSNSTAHVTFQNRRYTLSPEPVEAYSLIRDHGDVDKHFGGLGFARKMSDWFDHNMERTDDHWDAVEKHNLALTKKAKGGLFRKKVPTEPLMPQYQGHLFYDSFNRKLAEARVAARVESWNGKLMLIHPSSATGDLHAEMQKWADAHWTGVPERPWNDDVLAMPPVPGFS